MVFEKPVRGMITWTLTTLANPGNSYFAPKGTRLNMTFVHYYVISINIHTSKPKPVRPSNKQRYLNSKNSSFPIQKTMFPI